MSLNAFASMNPHITAGTGEKLHILRSKKGIPKDIMLKNQQDSKKQSWLTRRIAKKLDKKRRFLYELFVLLNRVSSQMKEGGAMNDHQHAAIMEFAENHPRPSDKMLDGYASMKEALHEFVEEHQRESEPNMPITKQTIARKVTCFHWTLDSITEDGIWFPLNRTLPGFRGHLMFAPASMWEATAGISIFQVDKERGRVEMYYGASLYAHVEGEHAPEPFKSWSFVGPADGESMDVTSPIRSPIVKPSKLLHGLWQLLQKLPVSHETFSSSPDEACPKKLYEECASYFYEHADEYYAMQQRFRTGLTLADQIDFLMIVHKCVLCEKNFLSMDDVSEKTVSWDLFAAVGGYHGTSEVFADEIVKGLYGRSWNADIDISDSVKV